MRSLLLWFIPILVISVASDAVFKVREPDGDQTSPAVLNRDKRTGMEIVTIRAAGVVALIAIPVAFLAVTSTIAAVFSVANFVYSVVQGRKQMKELKEIGKKLDEIENLINSRFNEISQELNEIKLISVYGRSVSIARYTANIIRQTRPQSLLGVQNVSAKKTLANKISQSRARRYFETIKISNIFGDT